MVNMQEIGRWNISLNVQQPDGKYIGQHQGTRRCKTALSLNLEAILFQRGPKIQEHLASLKKGLTIVVSSASGSWAFQ